MNTLNIDITGHDSSPHMFQDVPLFPEHFSCSIVQCKKHLHLEVFKCFNIFFNKRINKNLHQTNSVYQNFHLL